MDYDFSLEIISIQQPTFTIPKHDPFSNNFYINLNCTQTNYPLHINASNSTFDFMTKVNRTLLVPCDILCKCNEVTILDEAANIFLYDSFSSVPISSTILKEILPHLGEYARVMIADNDEGHNMWELDVTLDVITWYNEDRDAVVSLFNVDMLKNVGMGFVLMEIGLVLIHCHRYSKQTAID
ncbi:hypothetical protein RYX36_004453 [Vicia faba]